MHLETNPSTHEGNGEGCITPNKAVAMQKYKKRDCFGHSDVPTSECPDIGYLYACPNARMSESDVQSTLRGRRGQPPQPNAGIADSPEAQALTQLQSYRGGGGGALQGGESLNRGLGKN